MTNPTHFEIFLRYLDTYVKPLFTPFIKLGEKTKVPDGNWKQERYHISKEEALTRLKKGNNVGIVSSFERPSIPRFRRRRREDDPSGR